MKGLRKPLLLFVAGLALSAALLIESVNYWLGAHRHLVVQELHKVLGDDVRFETLELNLWGRPGFVASDFRIADDNRFAATPAVRARGLVLGLSPWHLLQRRLVVTSLTFEQAELQIITDESGYLNLGALIQRKSELRKFPRLRAGSADRKATAISFSVDEVAIAQGRIDYIDRSVRQPAELQVKNLSMRIRGFQPGEAMRVQVGASLTPGLRQDLRIEGKIAGSTESRAWLQREIDFDVQIDSLHVPLVARAIAALRDRIPRELDVTGPMSLQGSARGTFERPRLEDVTLKIPLFGSSEYNAIVTGRVQFGERRSWEEAELDGRLDVEPLSLNRLRNFAVFRSLFPESLVSEGSVKVVSRFAGTWEQLRMGALVLADNTDIRYKDWLRKPAAMPATIRARITKHKQRLIVHPSELDLGAQKLGFSGAVEYQPAPVLRLHVAAANAPVAHWGRILTVPGLQATAGNADLNVTASRSLSALDDGWDLHGEVTLQETALRHTHSGRSLEGVEGQLIFSGDKARWNRARVRLGTSVIFLEDGVAEWRRPHFQSAFRAEDLRLEDLPGIGVGPAARLKKARGAAQVVRDQDRWLLTGWLAAPETSVDRWLLRDLRAGLRWDHTGLKLESIQARAFDGIVHAEAFLPGGGGQTHPLVLSGRVEGVDARALLAHWFPLLRDRLDGRLFGHAQFEAAGADAAAAKEALAGFGHADLRSGVIRNFNLSAQLLLRGSDSAALERSRMPPGFFAMLQRRDTFFESARADFKLESNRLSTDNLLITTPDYTVTGAGWLGFDRSTRWNGMLVLSPRLTQELQREYRGLRYLLDRRGHVAIGFRVDGQIPQLSVRMENRAIAQALGLSSGEKGAEGSGGREGRTGKNWIPDALERYLNR